jgi:hypothetical protein
MLSDLAVGAVAQRPVYGMFAAAEIDFLVLGGRELDRCQASSLVGAITQRLFGRLAAGAPEVVFAFLDVHWIGFFLYNHRITHVLAFLTGVCPDYGWLTGFVRFTVELI